MSSTKTNSNIYNDEIDVGKYLQVLWKRRVIILIFTLVCAVSAGILSFLTPKTYQSELLLRIGKIGNVGNVGSIAIENEAMVVELIKSKTFLATVIKKYLKEMQARNIDPKELKELNVKATFEKDIQGIRKTEMVKIQAEANSPQQAAEIVNAIANEVITRHKEKFENAESILMKIEGDLDIQILASEKQIEELKKIISRIERDPKVDAPAVILLRANLNDTENSLTSLKQKQGNLKMARSILYTQNTNVTDPPVIPEKPIKPRKAIYIAIGTLIGLMLGIFWALVVKPLDSHNDKQKEI